MGKLFLTITLVLAVSAGCTTKPPRITPQECVEIMFSDPDRFDPASHFTIEVADAPPMYDAIEWINENLDDCLKDGWEDKR